MTSVVREMVDLIVSGQWSEGDLLPPEDALLERFGVSRTTLRESLQHIVAAGLIRSRPRAGTVIQPQAQWNLLEPTVLSSALQHVKDRSFYENLVDARSLIEPEAAALAARNGSPRALAAIDAAFADMIESEGRDTESWSAADLSFHSAIIEASDNWVYRQFIVAIRAALMASFRMTNRASQSHAEAIETHRSVYEAIRQRQPDRAKTEMLNLIALAREDMKRALQAD
ncbi:FadR/GntR family transcriptional regulator [Chelativorans sp. AA-79]|uniref:FadR/GntR family transcriptional regulator n=1 Tax=Chelativorans sp. AA-79 TaxID=3028735 RepID=UPI0023F95083|nr:FadR/GntR family transcriptional regulator [Chelativorans sp. AA-79]WEX08992.1 FadR/GntR family transcriptional regulator [Chelativorans sp. AA-79]